MLNIKKPTLLSLKVEIKSSTKLKAIVDSKVQFNIILATVAKKQNLVIRPILEIILLSLNRLDYTVYKFIVAKVRIKNLKSKIQTYRILFIVTNFKKLLIYLELF